MKAFKPRKKYQVSTKILVIFGLILFLTSFLLHLYSDNISSKIVIVSKKKITKFTENFLSNNIGYGILNNKNLENIMIINKNKNGEILYIDYNLDKAYEALQVITDVLYQNINDLENGNFKNIHDNDFFSINNNLALKLPFFVGSNSPLFSSLGPKIYVKVSLIGAVLTNINSKITSYGMNNALVELYVTIQITENLMTPVIEEDITFTYDVLVASKVINGRVPEIYGGVIDTTQNITNQ